MGEEKTEIFCGERERIRESIGREGRGDL